MIQVGTTGHRNLANFDMVKLEGTIYTQLEQLKQGQDKFILLSSIASGADQLCAQIGLKLGYELVCPLPFLEYRNDFSGAEQELYDFLLRQASDSFIVSDSSNKDAAYFAAGKYIVENCNVLLAVWDGRHQNSICGTEAVVTYAKSLGRKIHILTNL